MIWGGKFRDLKTGGSHKWLQTIKAVITKKKGKGRLTKKKHGIMAFQESKLSFLIILLNIYLSCIGVLGPDTIWHPTMGHQAANGPNPSAGTWIAGTWQCSTDWRHELGLKPTSNPGGFGAVSPIWGVSPGGRWLSLGHCKSCTFVGLQNAAFFGIRPASMGIELIWLIRHDSCCYSGTTAGMFKSGWASKNWR